MDGTISTDSWIVLSERAWDTFDHSILPHRDLHNNGSYPIIGIVGLLFLKIFEQKPVSVEDATDRWNVEPDASFIQSFIQHLFVISHVPWAILCSTQ